MKTFDSVIVRLAHEKDDIAKVARYIHLTDPYIYPTVTEAPDDPAWIALIGECFSDENNIYFRKRVWVAEIKEDGIVGVLCAIRCGKENLIFSAGKTIPACLKSGIARVEEGYYAPLLEESRSFDGYNIVNLCTDPAWRGCGIGAKLLNAFIDSAQHETIHLDVIQNNTPAVKLYEKLGFRIASSYEGFGKDGVDVPCFHMIRPPSVV